MIAGLPNSAVFHTFEGMLTQPVTFKTGERIMKDFQQMLGEWSAGEPAVVDEQLTNVMTIEVNN